MLPNFLQLFTGKPAAHYEASFVQDVQVTRKRTRNRGLERLLWWGWALIVIKSLLVWWACAHYPVPFHPLWIVLPTVAFATLCTALYVWRR